MAAAEANADAMSFGQRIQELRRQAGLTQRQVAAKLDIDFTYLSKLENSRGEPPGETTIRRLANLYRADPDELLALAGKIPPEVRQKAVSDPQFARFLRTLPQLSDDVLHKLYRDARPPSNRRGR